MVSALKWSRIKHEATLMGLDHAKGGYGDRINLDTNGNRLLQEFLIGMGCFGWLLGYLLRFHFSM